MSTVLVRKAGRPQKYPWATWFNGEVHVLKFGTDIQCGLPTFRTNLSKHAKKANITVRTSTDTKTIRGKSVTTITLQAEVPVHAKKEFRKSNRSSKNPG